MGANSYKLKKIENRGRCIYIRFTYPQRCHRSLDLHRWHTHE